MSIICGTDFSKGAVEAGRAAAALSTRLGISLKLIHVIDEMGAELTVGSLHDALYDPLREQLRQQAEELRRAYSANVETAICPGLAFKEVVSAAEQLHAELVVVSSEGGEKQHRWLLGSVANRIAQSSPAPVLVVREASGIEAWTSGVRPLSVIVGVDPARTSRAALQWAASLRRIGPCNLTVVELVEAVAEQRAPSAWRELEHELAHWAGELPGEGTTTFVVRVNEGSTQAGLSALTAELSADLLVIGAHQRKSVARLWHRSVSRAVLRHASANVACVPCHDVQAID